MKDLSEYLGNTQDAAFLFDEKIAVHLTGLYEKAVDLQTTQKLYEPLPVGKERERLCNKEHELLIDLNDELPKLKDVFGPYLKFKIWKWPVRFYPKIAFPTVARSKIVFAAAAIAGIVSGFFEKIFAPSHFLLHITLHGLDG